MLNKIIKSVFLLLLAVTYANAQYLSKLHAGKHAPLYSTYAAPMQRSAFALDEAYEFRFYVDSLGADFITDTGGEIGLGFKMENKWVYKVADMFKPPLITSSYPDMVKYEFFPFENIKVEAHFVVHSSRAALLDVKVHNYSPKKRTISIIPFIRNNYRAFSAVKISSDQIFFNHEEYPDGWTIEHKVPYTDSLRNILLLSEKADFAGAFNSEKAEAPIVPFEINLNQKVTNQINGRTYLPGKVRIPDAGKTVRLQMFVDGDFSKMLTEKSPSWATTQAIIDNGGYFRLEAAQLKVGAKKYEIYAQYLNKMNGKVAGILDQDKERRKDVDLEANKLPQSVEEPSVRNLPGAIQIQWKANRAGLAYSVYRRTYPQAYYQRIANQVTTLNFTDKTIKPDLIYGYVVVVHEKGAMSIHSPEVNNISKTVFNDFVYKGIKSTVNSKYAKVLAFEKTITLNQNEHKQLRIVRAVDALKASPVNMLKEANSLLKSDLSAYQKDNETLFAKTPVPDLKDEDRLALYWSANNMMRQVFYPAEGKTKYNYYVFSREPTWGWGHGGQVFHESIAMLSYAYIDPISAMNSQRVYKERQYENGYINYRTGAYLDEIIEHNGQLTSSAPWYSWLNWEVYKITKDEAFLKEMYESSKKFYKFYVDNRDSDRDGLCEWGGEAVLESVRDALVAVWDQVGYPTNFESIDLNCMLVMEAKSLENMAKKLGLPQEALYWKNDYEKRSALINQIFWDDENGFYYNVNKETNKFTFKKENDLKRDEIIGFLPLWAGIADQKKAGRLVKKLTDPTQFWRPYGVPSLSAQDPYYNAKGYWNGPVWVEWDYLIMRGLIDYGYKNEAKELVDRVAKGMIEVLKKDHNLWEFYSPDEAWGGYHRTYIWAGIINRMMLDTNPNSSLK